MAAGFGNGAIAAIMGPAASGLLIPAITLLYSADLKMAKNIIRLRVESNVEIWSRAFDEAHR
ncbi:hypothetical protein ACPZ19_38775 [Amycolatopsis lurida]